MRLLLKTPMRTFTLLSLVLIIMVMLGVGFVQSIFYHRAITEREGNDIRDVAEAMASRYLNLEDLKNHRDPKVQELFNLSFAALSNLSETVSIRVYNLNHDILWSDNPNVIGKRLHANHEIRIALKGQNVVSFYSNIGSFRHHDYLPEIPLVEYHVPLYVKNEITGEPEIGGMFALFRSTQTLNEMLNLGSALIWGVTGIGGLILYVALAVVFWSVYRRQQETEIQVSELITEKQKQQRIFQMEKLSEMGMMIGEIAHQINNPLVGVVNMAELAEREVSNNGQTRKLLVEIRKAGEDCRTFIQRLLTFSAISHSEKISTDIKKLLLETIALFQQSAESHPPVVTEFPDAEVTLNVDPVLIRHAVFNLLSNAAKANPAGGTITVGLHPETRIDDSAAGWSLFVRDRGIGLADDVLENIFTPFFSTHADGTGLGLSVVQQVAIMHDGHVSAANNPDSGAIFAVWLPDSI